MSTKNPLPDWEYLNECFSYESSSGKLYWKKRPLQHHSSVSQNKRFNTRYSLREAGRLSSRGYRTVIIDKKEHSVNRVIWKLVNKEDIGQDVIIDHRDGNKENNRIENLRKASATQNNHNRRICKRNSTGYKGVSRAGDRYKAAIRVGNGKRLYLGYFDDPEAAHEAYVEASKKYHGDFSNSG